MARIPRPNETLLKLETAVVSINMPFLIVLHTFIDLSLQLVLKHNRLRLWEHMYIIINIG